MSTSFPSLPPLAGAIAQAEGYGTPNSIPTIANNPGNLELGNLGYGTLQAAGGQQITIFPDISAGWSALTNQIQSIFNGNSKNYNPNQSLSDFGSIYSGGNANYGNTLASILGVSPNTTLAQANGASDAASSGPLSGLTQWWNQNDPLFGNNGYLTPNGNWLDNPLGKGVRGVVGTGVSALADLIFSQRLIILFIGLLLIAAGLFTFKTTQTVIETAAKAAKKGAALAG